jgi:hypothetical protein
MKRVPKPDRPMARLTYGFDEPDRQGPRVFVAEDHVPDVSFPGVTALCRWMNGSGLLDSDWWLLGQRKWFPDGDTRDVVVYGRSLDGRGHAEVTRGDADENVELWLPRWAWTQNVVLHELTHVVVSPFVKQCHGPEYAKARLQAQRLFGARGTWEQLRREFKDYGVEVSR